MNQGKWDDTFPFLTLSLNEPKIKKLTFEQTLNEQKIKNEQRHLKANMDKHTCWFLIDSSKWICFSIDLLKDDTETVYITFRSTGKLTVPEVLGCSPQPS